MGVDLSHLRDGSRRDEIPYGMFDVSGRDFNQPQVPPEESIAYRILYDVILNDAPVTYEIVDAVAKRGAP